MILTNEQFHQLVAAGGGLIVDAATMTFNQLRDLAVAANGSHARITIKNCSGLTAQQLKDLASLAPALLVFDLTS
jgi:precorrin-6B methylase 2